MNEVQVTVTHLVIHSLIVTMNIVHLLCVRISSCQNNVPVFQLSQMTPGFRRAKVLLDGEDMRDQRILLFTS